MRRTATLQQPRREMMTNLVHEVVRVTCTDPTTARLVVADFRETPLLGERQADQAPACQLKITKPNSLHQSPMARQLRRQLEVIRAALAPPPEQRSDATSHSPTGNHEELPLPPPGTEHPELPVPQRLLPVPPPSCPSHPPLPRAPGPLRRWQPSPAGERRLPGDRRPGHFKPAGFLVLFVMNCLVVLSVPCHSKKPLIYLVLF